MAKMSKRIRKARKIGVAKNSKKARKTKISKKVEETPKLTKNCIIKLNSYLDDKKVAWYQPCVMKLVNNQIYNTFISDQTTTNDLAIAEIIGLNAILNEIANEFSIILIETLNNNVYNILKEYFEHGTTKENNEIRQLMNNIGRQLSSRDHWDISMGNEKDPLMQRKPFTLDRNLKEEFTASIMLYSK